MNRSIAWFVVALVGCSNPSADTEPTTRSQALTPVSLEILDSIEREGERLVIAGNVERVPVGTDAPRVVVVEQAPPDFASLRGQRVLDARFADDGVVVLGTDQVLRHVTPQGTFDLAEEVLAPLSVEGDRVAYVTGMPPDIQVVVSDLGTGARTEIAPTLQPAWSPALSPDGSEVVFAASYGGRPQLFRANLIGGVEPMPTTAVVPSSPRAPIWRGDTLVFDHEGGVAVFDLAQRTIVQEIADARLAPGSSGGVRVTVDGHERVLEGVSDEN